MDKYGDGGVHSGRSYYRIVTVLFRALIEIMGSWWGIAPNLQKMQFFTGLNFPLLLEIVILGLDVVRKKTEKIKTAIQLSIHKQ